MEPPPDPPRHPLRGLLVAQFLGAFNDNAWKLIVALLALKALQEGLAPGPALESASQTQATLAFAVFTLALLVGSLPAGALTDRFSKRSVLVAMKGVEVWGSWGSRADFSSSRSTR